MAAWTEVPSWELHSNGVCKTDTRKKPTVPSSHAVGGWSYCLLFPRSRMQKRLPESIKCNYYSCFELRALNKPAEEFIATNTRAADSLAPASARNKSTPKHSGHSLDITKSPAVVLLCKDSSLFFQPASSSTLKSFLLRFAVWCL